MLKNGSGIWVGLRRAAKTFRDTPHNFWAFLDDIIENDLTCNVCHQDALEYRSTHPEEDTVTWMWKYNNYVNLKLRKIVFPHPDGAAWHERETSGRGRDDPYAETHKLPKMVLSGFYL